AAVRPRYVRTIDADPYSESRQEFHFFVPVRDQPRGERDLPKPHEVAVALPEGIPVGDAAPTPAEESGEEPAPAARPGAPRPAGARGRAGESAPTAPSNSFTVGLRDDTFILY